MSRPQTNGVAERAVRRVKEGTSTTLLQSGFEDQWWSEAMSCYCFLRNIVDTLRNDKTAYETRFGAEFRGPIVRFGAEVQYKPSSDADKARLPAFGENVLPGLFAGYHQHTGGGWSGDVYVIDQENLEDSESYSDVYLRRVSATEINILYNSLYFY